MCLVVVLDGLAAPVFSADTELERTARTHFQKGEAHYTAGQFREALSEYWDGFDAVPLPGFLVNIAQCQRRLGDLRHALASYQKFVLVAPSSPLVPEVRKMMADLQRLIAEANGDVGSAEPVGPGGPASAAAPAIEDATADGPLEPSSLGALAGNPILVGGGGPVTVSPATGHRVPALMLMQPMAPREVPAAHWTRWWLWGSIGAVVLGGTIVAILLTRPDAPATIHDGTLGALRR